MEFIEYKEIMDLLKSMDSKLKMIEEAVGYIELKLKKEDGWEPED